MSFWNRRKNEVAEAQDYLRANDNVSRPMALLLSLLGFIIVFALIFSIFIGGRWLYQQYNDTDDDQETTQIIASDSSENASNDNSVTLEVGAEFGSSNEGASSNSSASTDMNSENGTTVTSSATTDSNGAGNGNTVVAGENDKAPAVESLPRTGPVSTITLLIAVAIVAGAAHNLYARR